MVIAISGLILFACATTEKITKIEKSGFLKNYDQLKPGTSDEAQLIYINEKIQFSNYKKIIIDPVQIWGAANTKLDYAERQLLMTYLDSSMRNSLKTDYQIVTQPGPGTMRLRVAITDAEGADVFMDAVATVVPGSTLLLAATKVSNGTYAFVGESGIEAEITDSMTGLRLMADVDRRAGTGQIQSKGKWASIKDSYDHWTHRLKLRLAKLRSGIIDLP